MRALLAIVALLAGCGDDDDAPATKLPSCAITAADLRTPTQANSACISKLFATEPARAAALLGQLDWVKWKDTTRELEALPVDARSWYLVAAEPDVLPRAALSALQLARRTPDARFAADTDLAAVRIAMRTSDESTANTAIDRLLENDSLLGAQKLELLGLLSQRSEQPRIDRICRKANEPAIAWRCLELAPHLRESLAGCGRLPVLSFRDVAKFAPLRGKLVGLRCTSEEARGINSVFKRVDQREPAIPEEVTIYSRLALDAPPSVARCFLEEAARACLAVIHRNEPCPVLDSVASYVAAGTNADRAIAFAAVVEGKNREYDLLYRRVPSQQAGANLFHLHVLLGEMVVASSLFPSPTKVFQIPQYHVNRAWRFWREVEQQTVAFPDMLSARLRKAVCDDKDCSNTCKNATGFGCANACKLEPEIRASVCIDP